MNLIDDLTHRMICGRKIEFTAAEKAQILAERIEFQSMQATRDAERIAKEQKKATLKQSVIDKLGITEEELNLLMGK